MFSKQEKKDVLFGEFNDGENTLEMHNVSTRVGFFTSQDFTVQLSRVLRANNGYINLVADTSHPPFDDIIEAINPGYIHLVRITRRTDLNSAVKATLECHLYTEDGLIQATTQWCAYKEMRAQEIVETLLLPLQKQRLLPKTYLDWGDGFEEMVAISQDFERAIQDLFALSGYPEMRIEIEACEPTA